MGDCTAKMIATGSCPRTTIQWKRVEPTVQWKRVEPVIEWKTTCDYLIFDDKGIKYYNMCCDPDQRPARYSKGNFGYMVVDDRGIGTPANCKNGDGEECWGTFRSKAFDRYRKSWADFVIAFNQTLARLNKTKIPDAPPIEQPPCDRYFDPECKGNAPRFSLPNGMTVMGEFEKGKLEALHFSLHDGYDGTRTRVLGFSVSRSIFLAKNRKAVVHVHTELLDPVMKLFKAFEVWDEKRRATASSAK
jgi:hypothetical protein